MKTKVNLYYIGVAIELPTINNYAYFSDNSLDLFEKSLLNYDYSNFGVSIKNVDSLNVCCVIGCMFYIIDESKLNINALKNFLQTKANITIKEDKETKNKILTKN